MTTENDWYPADRQRAYEAIDADGKVIGNVFMALMPNGFTEGSDEGRALQTAKEAWGDLVTTIRKVIV